ncbi:MAG: DUF3110 domain-containing protein [Microcoleaceae cyanobacterium]
MRVYVLLFNAGTENEGIHTIQMRDRNKVLMFESEEDATRFSVLLEAQDFPEPSVEAISDEEIKEFCRSADYDWELIPEGHLAIPPEDNVEQTDWDINNSPDSPADNESQDESEFPPDELDSIRRRLEGLL